MDQSIHGSLDIDPFIHPSLLLPSIFLSIIDLHFHLAITFYRNVPHGHAVFSLPG